MGVFVVDESSRTIDPCTGQTISTLGASDVIASQVGTGTNNISFSSSLQESPVRLNFSFESNPDSILDSYRCVFWNFSDPWALLCIIVTSTVSTSIFVEPHFLCYSVGEGSWVTEGVTTNNTKQTDSVTTVRCSSTHLTSFAVLVDVAGGLQVKLKPQESLLAKSYAQDICDSRKRWLFNI